MISAVAIERYLCKLVENIRSSICARMWCNEKKIIRRGNNKEDKRYEKKTPEQTEKQIKDQKI